MDLYAVLGVKPGASSADIRRAYRRLARKYHPGINPGDSVAEKRYGEITEAYETLIDPERRRQYDQGGVATERPTVRSVGFEGFDFSVAAVEGPRASTFGDLFADVIHQRFDRPAAGAERGADLYGRVEVPFEEAIRGTERSVTITRMVACTACGGLGTVHTSEARCLFCNGTGTIKSARGHMVFVKACSYCGGTGRQRQIPCTRCGGHGLQANTESVAVQVPAGTADGTELCVAGKGHSGRAGAPSGDLYVTVQVQPHPVFRRVGDDVFLQVPVAVHEAGLGARIDIPTLEGAARLRVPPGTQSGQRFRLRERGVPSPRDGRRGDLIVEVRIVLPRLIDERMKELLREFGRANTEDPRAQWGE